MICVIFGVDWTLDSSGLDGGRLINAAETHTHRPVLPPPPPEAAVGLLRQTAAEEDDDEEDGSPVPAAAPCDVAGLAVRALGRKPVLGEGDEADEEDDAAAIDPARGREQALLPPMLRYACSSCCCCCLVAAAASGVVIGWGDGAVAAADEVAVLLLPLPPKPRAKKEFMLGRVFSTMAGGPAWAWEGLGPGVYNIKCRRRRRM